MDVLMPRIQTLSEIQSFHELDMFRGNLDAGKAKTVVKPLTRSREKATHSQSQQQNVLIPSYKESQLITNTQVGNGSGIIIVRKAHE